MSDDDRIQRGEAVLERLFGRAPRPGDMPEGFREATVGHLFGDVWSRPGLAIEERSLVTVTALTVLGRENELRLHLRGARNLGIPREKIEELLLHLAHYGGWPVAVSALRLLPEVYDAEG